MTLKETKEFSYWLANIFICASAVIGLISLTAFGRDATDSEWPSARSGMKLTVDQQTKCEYLSSPNGGITPRLSSTGQHLGCIK